MAERHFRVEITDSFLRRLDAIEDFLTDADAAFAYDALLEGLRQKVIPNLMRFLALMRFGQLPANCQEGLL